MIYQEFQPHPFWQSFVASYWLASGEGTSASRIYPDGCVDLIFHGTGSERLRVSGMMTYYRDVAFNGKTELIGIRLKPAGLSFLQELPMAELKNISSRLSEVSTWPTGEWNERLWGIEAVQDKIHWIEAYLLPQLFHSRRKEDQLITSVCQDIESRYTNIDIGALTRQYYVSLRQLERRFKSFVGVSMKEYQRIFRFTQTLSDIRENSSKSLLQIAFDHGYTDHAHLTREVQRMTGRNPSVLRELQ
ncbi:MAG: AraC family transcriptional regulator [Saprospiraceae bacterium]|nr:AraC family transcriptional regulator [Saprospiraceae bacterium]